MSIARRVRSSRSTIKNILLDTNTRTQREIAKTGRVASANTRSTAAMAGGKVISFIRQELAKPDLTFEQIAEKAGVDRTTVIGINADEKIRLSPRSIGVKVGFEKKYRPIRQAAIDLLSERTPDGRLRYSQQQVVGLLKDRGTPLSDTTIVKLASSVRSEKERLQFRGRSVTNAFRRDTFLERALKLTRLPVQLIVERAAKRELRKGRKTTNGAIRNAIVRVKRERGLKGMRFEESKRARGRVLKQIVREGKIPLKIDWDSVSRRLKYPVYFVRETVALDMLASRRYHPMVIQERTGLSLERIKELQAKRMDSGKVPALIRTQGV